MAIKIIDWGLLDYDEAWQKQKDAVHDVIGGAGERVYICEHPPVLTMGRLADESHILYSAKELKMRGVALRHIDRGGEVTLHAPGQLVIYPILDLKKRGKDLKEYLSILEKVGIDFLREFDIVANRQTGRTGAWVGEKKIVSVGIGVKKWITYHGLAVNVNTDLSLFSLIRPCGLDVTMTSVSDQKGGPVDYSAAKEIIQKVCCKQWNEVKQYA